ncbi:MAG: DNA repair protein RadC [Pseudomonadales bacterium]|nr:DNA repair protein RadC [Pseudomonadales bacterium]
MSIAAWPTTERPREKLIARGPQALSDAELLAIFLRTGSPRHSAIEIAGQLLTQFGGLAPLLHASRRDFVSLHGLGDAKYAMLQAIQEISRRSMLEALQRSSALTSPEKTRGYLKNILAHQPREIFWALFLDSQHQVIASEALAYGTIDSASIYPREVLKASLSHNAAALIFAHNHPSGSLTPSKADQDITRRLQEVLAMVDIRVLDHIIIGGNRTVSMAELGLI